MARDKRDILNDRFFESVFYGTPSYSLSRTPDGRIVSELNKTRREGAKQQFDTLSVQKELITALKKVHGGSHILSAEDFRKKRYETQEVLSAAVAQLSSLPHSSDAFLEEARVLNMVAGRGFDELGDEVKKLGQITGKGLENLGVKVDRTTTAIHGVEFAVREAKTELVEHRMDSRKHAREAQGPRAAQEDPAELIHSPERFLQVLGAYQNGLLNETGRRDVEELIDARLSSEKAKRFFSDLIGKNIEDQELRKDTRTAIRIIERPSLLINEPTKNDAIQQLRRLEEVVKIYPDDELELFIRNIYVLMNMAERARQIGVDRSLLVDLTNNNLVVETVSHEVKKRFRGARLDGSAVDRNFNLLELLKQGDYAVAQREEGLDELRKHTALGGAIVIGQGILIQKGIDAEEQRAKTNGYLGDIIDGLIGTNNHLIDLEELAKGFIEAINYGFSQVRGVLERDAAVELEALNSIATQIAISRAATLAQIRVLDDTFERVGEHIQAGIQIANAQLGRLIELSEDSLGNLAKQRLRQGAVFLRSAETPEDFREAFRLFEEGISDDPTVIGNQYGAAIAAETLGEEDKAMAHYRVVGRMSEHPTLASSAWTKYAELKRKSGDLPEAVSSFRKAVERDKENRNAKFKLTRELILMGLTEEAAEVALALVVGDIRILYTTDIEVIFGREIARTIYINLFKNLNPIIHKTQQEGVENNILEEMILFCLERGLEMQDETILVAILESVPEFFYVDIFLSTKRRTPVFAKKVFDKIDVLKLGSQVKKIIQKETNFNETTSLVIAFLCLRCGLPSEDTQLAVNKIKSSMGKSKIAWFLECLRIDPERTYQLQKIAGIECQKIAKGDFSSDPLSEDLHRAYHAQDPEDIQPDIQFIGISEALGKENPLTGQPFIESVRHIEKGLGGEIIFWIEDDCLKIADCRIHRNSQGKTYMQNESDLQFKEGLTMPTAKEIEQIAKKALGFYGEKALMVQLAGRKAAVIFKGQVSIHLDQASFHTEMGTFGILRVPLY